MRCCHTLYTGTTWRPPYESDMLLLEATAGCTHHKCKFFTLYEDLPFSFRMSPMEDIKEDLAEVYRILKRFQGYAYKRSFLIGANSFMLKFQRLMDIAEQIHRYIPTIETIGCFARITDVTLKTNQELRSLRQAGFNGLSIEVKTGHRNACHYSNSVRHSWLRRIRW